MLVHETTWVCQNPSYVLSMCVCMCVCVHASTCSTKHHSDSCIRNQRNARVRVLLAILHLQGGQVHFCTEARGALSLHPSIFPPFWPFCPTEDRRDGGRQSKERGCFLPAQETSTRMCSTKGTIFLEGRLGMLWGHASTGSEGSCEESDIWMKIIHVALVRMEEAWKPGPQ